MADYWCRQWHPNLSTPCGPLHVPRQPGSMLASWSGQCHLSHWGETDTATPQQQQVWLVWRSSPMPWSRLSRATRDAFNLASTPSNPDVTRLEYHWEKYLQRSYIHRKPRLDGMNRHDPSPAQHTSRAALPEMSQVMFSPQGDSRTELPLTASDTETSLVLGNSSRAATRTSPPPLTSPESTLTL